MAYPTNHPKYNGKTAEQWHKEYEALTGFVQAVSQEYGIQVSPDPFHNLYELRKALRRHPRGGVAARALPTNATMGGYDPEPAGPRVGEGYGEFVDRMRQRTGMARAPFQYAEMIYPREPVPTPSYNMRAILAMTDLLGTTGQGWNSPRTRDR